MSSRCWCCRVHEDDACDCPGCKSQKKHEGQKHRGTTIRGRREWRMWMGAWIWSWRVMYVALSESDDVTSRRSRRARGREVKKMDGWRCDGQRSTDLIFLFFLYQYSSPVCQFRHSIVASIPACHAGDQGSIPCVGGILFSRFSATQHPEYLQDTKQGD